MAYNELLPTGNLQISYKTTTKPLSVKLQPTGEKIRFTYVGNRIEFMAPPVELHSIVEIAY
jgi:hypothetical protein